MSPLRVFAVVAVFGILCACSQEQLPTSPSELSVGIVIYEHPDYSGASGHITSDAQDLGKFLGPCKSDFSTTTATDFQWDDCISSVRMAPGWHAQLFEDEDFEGEMLTGTSDIPT